MNVSPCPPQALPLVATLLLAVALFGCGQPPLGQIEAAKRAMERAARAGGVLRAPAVCTAAQAALALAEAEIRVQMKRSSWSRRFDEANVLADKALEAGRSCAAHAQAALDYRRTRAESAIEDLRDAIAHTTALSRHVPDGEGIKSRLLRAAISLGEGRTSYGNGQYERAEEAAARGRGEIATAVTEIGTFIDTYSADPRRRTWGRWIAETLKDSKSRGKAVVIVDKLRRQLLVLRGDDELASYDVDLGLGGMDSKTRAGDAFTPEGRYKITEVRNPGQTRYYRALMLDYPNPDDVARFRALQKAGRVPRGVHIGSNIEIHGEGGRDQDWTQGCVALSNDDMDEMVGLVDVGTPVTIVGMIPDGAIE
jgi:L,D-transpeptidase-like protein